MICMENICDSLSRKKSLQYSTYTMTKKHEGTQVTNSGRYRPQHLHQLSAWSNYK